MMIKKEELKENINFYSYSSLLIGLFCLMCSVRFLSASPFVEKGITSLLYFFSFSFFYYSFIGLLISLPCFLLSIVGLRRIATFLFICCESLFFIYFVADTFVYQQFRMHLNFAMLQMTLMGGGQVVSFSASMILQILSYVLVCVFIALLCSYFIKRYLTKRWGIGLLATLFIVTGFLSVQVIFGVSFARQETQLTQVKQLLPLVRPLRFNKLLIKVGLVTPEQIYSVKTVTSSGRMNYPPKLNCGEGKGYNILFLFIDALRFDMITPEVMPNVYKFSKQSLVFKDHYSGGIKTRHGIFTLFTGIPGSYWEASLQSKSGSALISALQQNNYAIGIFTGAPLTMPEFNQTIFADVPNLRLDSRGNTPLERDENAIYDFEKWLTTLPKGQRFFSFIFLDNVHASEFPIGKEYEIFKPYWKEINHLKLDNNFDRTEFFNRYKNSAHFADLQLGKILSSVSRYVDLENTIVVIGSDHGEEFNDNKLNFWGHNGNFTKFQAKTPLVIRWPGKGHLETEERTSMLDIVPTILPEVLGCTNPINEYSAGLNLFSQDLKKRQFVYSSNYSQNAFIEKERIILINELGILNFLDNNYRPSKDKSIPVYIPKVLEETSKFSK